MFKYFVTIEIYTLKDVEIESLQFTPNGVDLISPLTPPTFSQ
ncbi:hypothetical protein T05_7056 [Trichinella murrelli]|uniref:Uncharacterized protein n=1 Tax=Trichinella murrelli TaxID=144512 RepID=A0A0V0SRV8_9BILA|nr:hypothetical protein T05_7056 [Trichinella murrelli]